MEATKPQGPSRAVLIGSAALLTLVLVGAAYFLGDSSPAMLARPSLVASTFQPLLERCDDEPRTEPRDGTVRTSCLRREDPAFAFYAEARGDAIEKAGLMVPASSREEDRDARTSLGLELFSLIAGVPAQSFIPTEQLQDIGSAKTELVRDGLVYVTEPVAGVGLVFSVSREPTNQEN
jgi:hypothetical protein